VDSRRLIVSQLVLPIADLIRGTSFMQKTKFLRESQWWDKERIIELQETKLRALLSHAYLHVPYYRRILEERNLHPSDIKTIEDLTKLPILTKSQVRRFKHELISENYSPRMLKPGRTGGSTGEPLQFYNDANALSWAWGAMNRYYEWTGMQLGEGRFDIGGGSLGGFIKKGGIKDILSKTFRRIQKLEFYPIFDLDLSMAKRISADARRLHVRVVRGYPSGLYILARFALSEGLDFQGIKIVQSTSERLYPEQRETIESGLSADIFDQYGAGEILSIAAQCEEKKAYHVFDEHVIVENEKTLASKDGRVPAIVTDLDNYAMPFIRYELGDILNFKESDCTCGRGLSTIGKVEGRTHDFLSATDGRPIPGEFIPHLFQKVQGFDRYFVHQLSESEIIVNIVRNEQYSDSEIRQLMKLMKDVLGQEMKIHFESVAQIELSPTGKLSFIKSEVKPVFG
jgi:phenylacetate-CoA ligase